MCLTKFYHFCTKLQDFTFVTKPDLNGEERSFFNKTQKKTRNKINNKKKSSQFKLLCYTAKVDRLNLYLKKKDQQGSLLV